MKIIIEGDKHVGTRKDDVYLANAIKESSQFLCDYAKQHDIKVLIQTGDWFDCRSGLSQETLNFQRLVLTPMYESVFDDLYVIVGNHDMHLKNKITPNSVFEVFGKNNKWCIIEKPTTFTFGNTLWDLFPWKCDENKDQIDEFARSTNSDYSVGHWELDGFEFYKGIPSTGESMDFLERYKIAFSGHYHTQSNKGNIKYVGTPYTLTMGDANETRGFHVFDTDTKELLFVANPNCYHHRLVYDSSFDPSVIKKYENKNLVLVVNEFDDKLDGILTQFENICNEFKHTQNYVFESSYESESGELENISINKHISNFIDGLDIDGEDKLLCINIADELYKEAINK